MLYCIDIHLSYKYIIFRTNLSRNAVYALKVILNFIFIVNSMKNEGY